MNVNTTNNINNTNNTKKKSKHIFYLDALRALAIISVVLFHTVNTCGFLMNSKAVFLTYDWWITDIGKTCLRCGVDIFLMLSGALSLGRDWEIKPFLKKRLPRITAPFLLWGFILSAIVFVLALRYPDLIIIKQSFGSSSYWAFLLNSYLAKSVVCGQYWFGQYWFFWTILGTYLIMPILNRWLFHSDLKEAEYFLFFWLITCTFDYTLGFSFPVNLTYFTGPIGMVVLGYYLRHTKRKVFNNIKVSILLIVVGLFLSIFSSYLLSTPNKLFFTLDRYSLFMAIQVTGIFTLFKNISQLNLNILGEDGFIKKIISSIAQCSYGIYLTHRVVLCLLFLLLAEVLPYKQLLVVVAVVGFTVPWFVLIVLNKVPYLNEVIGVK